MSDGVTRERQAFFDDPNKSLGLQRKASTPDPEVFDRGGDKLPKPSKLREIEIEQRRLIIEAEREQRESEIAKLVAQGCTAKQAAEILDHERKEERKYEKERKALERADRHLKAVENDMGMHKKPAKHGGSKSGRARTAKKGTWLCRDCKMEWCEHRPIKSAKRGRPPIGGRSKQIKGKVSAKVAAILPSADLKAGAIVEAVVMAAAASGFTIAQTLAVLRGNGAGVEAA